MGCCANIFMHIWIWIKMAIVSTKYMFLECCVKLKRMAEIPRREGEYAVITGGNRGIGWYTVKGLTDAGMKVIVGCRDGASKAMLFERIQKEGIAAEQVEWIECDMSSTTSVRAFAKKIVEKKVPVHLLINNAGIMFVDRVETQDGFESHLAVNYLSHFLLTHLLLPSLKAAGKEGRAARVVNLTSSAQFFDWFQISDLHGKDFYSKPGAYSQSKIAQVMFTRYMDNLMSTENAPVKSYCLHPGFISSNLYTQTWWAHSLIYGLGFCFRSEAQGADRSLYVALAPEVEDLNGSYFENSSVAKPVAVSRSLDTQQKLWDITCQMLNIQKFGCA